jgi:ABC-type phosphate/phosphonate transport system ATPase subunit
MVMNDELKASRCGYVAIVGRPNVGKSTLLNHILGQKLAITSRKPQTTRHNMLGIKTEGEVQTIYVDTPGLHKENQKALNRFMNKTAVTALRDVDVVVFVVDRTRWTDEDQMVLERGALREVPGAARRQQDGSPGRQGRHAAAPAMAAGAVAGSRAHSDLRPAWPQSRRPRRAGRRTSAGR